MLSSNFTQTLFRQTQGSLKQIPEAQSTKVMRVLVMGSRGKLVIIMFWPMRARLQRYKRELIPLKII